MMPSNNLVPVQPSFEWCKNNLEECVKFLTLAAYSGFCTPLHGVDWCYKLVGIPEGIVVVNEKERVGVVFTWGKRAFGIYILSTNEIEVRSALYYGVTNN